MSNEQQAPMTREDLIFAIGQAHGMISRLISGYRRTLETPNATTQRQMLEDIAEARQMQQEFLARWYGAPNQEALRRIPEQP